MLSRLSLFAVCALVAVVCVAATGHVVKEQLKGQSHCQTATRWITVSRASPDQQLSLIFLLRQRNLDVLEARLMETSDPTSEEYGQHMTHAEVNALVAPEPRDIGAVLNWIRTHIHSSVEMESTPNMDFVKITATVEEAERMLHTQYHEYAHVSGKHQIVRALSYKLPSDIAPLIDSVGPTVRFPSAFTIAGAQPAKKENHKAMKVPARRKLRGSKAAPKKPAYDCTQGTTPDCLKGLYTVNDYVAATGTKSTVAVTGYLEQYIAASDLAAFFAAYDPTHARTATIIGPNDQTNPGTEASLDIQYSMGVAPGIPGTFWYTAGRQPNNTQNEPFLDFLMALASTADAPWVVSTSYGDDEPTVDYGYATRMNVEFQKLGARGISILFSSGDGGVSGGQSQQCTNFIPTYPAGSPYVTSVGGTTGFPESGVSFSSGGFTNYWSVPSYQSAAVQNFLTTSTQLPQAGLWNATGRGFPDVSAQGTNYPVFQGGFAQPVDGTSCSTPTFSAIVSLLNDVRFAAGKSSLGFLNPLFYTNPQMFTDITSGNNPGCGTNGFFAQKGWDPITGLGTPLFSTMASVVKNLP